MLAVIRVGQLASGFEHGDAKAGFGEALGGPPAGRARAHDDDVEGLECVRVHAPIISSRRFTASTSRPISHPVELEPRRSVLGFPRDEESSHGCGETKTVMQSVP